MAQELFPVQIAEFTAWGFAIPDALNWGGAQRLGVHQLPAGIRVVDSLGPDDADISWKGTFLKRGAGDPDPVEAAQYIDHLRKKGGAVTLSWDIFQYKVLIEHFKPSYEFPTRVAFDIVMKVIEDLAGGGNDSFEDSDVDSLVRDDYSNTLSLSEQANMSVPADLPSSASTTAVTPATLASSSASTTTAATNPDGTAIPTFATKDDALAFISEKPSGYSADYVTP